MRGIDPQQEEQAEGAQQADMSVSAGSLILFQESPSKPQAAGANSNECAPSALGAASGSESSEVTNSALKGASHQTVPLPTGATATAARMTHYRWVVIALGFVIIVINYMDRTAISYAIGPISKEFGLTNTDFGYILAAFGVGYMVMTLGGGIIADLWGARRVWTGAAIAWSVITAMLGLSTGIWMFFVLRALLGITEGPCFPALQRVVTDWLPLNERGKSVAIGLAAVPLASVIGAPLISHLILTLGWKMMFFVLGGLGVIWAAIWYAVFRDYPQNSKYVSQAELDFIHEGRQIAHGKSDDELRRHHLKTGTTTWRFILLNPSLMANNLAFFSFGYLLFFAVGWLPGYLEQTFAVNLKQVGLYLIAPWTTAAIMVTAGGFLSDWLWKKTGSFRISRTHVIWTCQLLSALCFLAVTTVHSLPLAVTFISLGLGFGFAPNAAFYAVNSDLARDRAATSLGLMDSFLAAAGILSPALTGILADSTGNFNSAIFLLVGFTVASVVAILLFQHPDREVRLAKAS